VRTHKPELSNLTRTMMCLKDIAGLEISSFGFSTFYMRRNMISTKMSVTRQHMDIM